jgi:hypothetical protein
MMVGDVFNYNPQGNALKNRTKNLTSPFIPTRGVDARLVGVDRLHVFEWLFGQNDSAL